jgi:CRISPR-associated protein Cas5d
MKNYLVEIEIAGDLALFSRPDTGGTPSSFPVPTWSAAKGIFETIARLSSGDAWISPTAVEVCVRKNDSRRGHVRFQNYAFNYGGPLRKSSQINGGNSLQVFSTVLSDVCYRIYGEVRGDKNRNKNGGVNPCHHLQEMFNRRLARGQCHRTPCLGLSEFTASYWGLFRDELTEVDTALNLRLPSILITPFSSPVNGTYKPKYQLNVKIEKGKVKYDS